MFKNEQLRFIQRMSSYWSIKMSNGIIIVRIFNWSNNINGPLTAEQISNTNLHKSHKGMRKTQKEIHSGGNLQQ